MSINANVDSKDNRKEHVASIRTNVKKQKEDMKAGICPKCGGALRERNGKYGKFTGCRNYPKCRFIVK